MKKNRDITKILIETSPTVEAADKIINELFEFETFEEKADKYYN